MRPILLSLVLILTSVARAGISESPEWIIKSAQHSMMRKLSEKLGWDDRPLPKGLVVLVQLSGASASVMAIGPINGDAKAYARVLEQFGKESRWKSDTVWSQENDGAAAKIETSAPRFGQMSGTMTVNLPALRRALSAVDANPRIALRAAKHTTVQGEKTPVSENRAWRLSEAPATTVTARAEVSPGIWYLLGAFFFAIPVIGGGLFLGAITVAKRESIPVARRRSLYKSLVTGGTTGLLLLHAPLAAFVLTGSYLRAAGDLWFGSSSVSWAMLPVLLMVAPLLAVFPWLKRHEIKLFGPVVGEPDPAAEFGLPPKPVVDPAVRKAAIKAMAKKNWILLYGVPLLIGSPSLVRLIAPKADWRANLIFLVAIPAALLFQTRALSIDRMVDRSHFTESPELTADVAEIAMALGENSARVFINDDPVAELGVALRLDKGQVLIVTRRAVNILDPAELRWLMTEAIVSGRSVFWRGRARVYVILGAAAVTVFSVATGLTGSIAPMFVGIAVLGLLTHFVLSPALKKDWLESDLRVLAVTGNLEAAESALRKCHADSGIGPLPTIVENRIKMWKLASPVAHQAPR